LTDDRTGVRPAVEDWVVDPLALRVQFPGPSSGTLTDSNPARGSDNSPLSAFAFDIGATGFTLDVVTLKKFLATDDVVFVVFAVTITGVDVDVVVVVGLVDVVESGLGC